MLFFKSHLFFNRNMSVRLNIVTNSNNAESGRRKRDSAMQITMHEKSGNQGVGRKEDLDRTLKHMTKTQVKVSHVVPKVEVIMINRKGQAPCWPAIMFWNSSKLYPCRANSCRGPMPNLHSLLQEEIPKFPASWVSSSWNPLKHEEKRSQKEPTRQPSLSILASCLTSAKGKGKGKWVAMV